MLTVIVILGILAGLVAGAIFGARRAAKRAAVTMEIHNLDLALNAYKDKFGEYPPDFAGVNSSDAKIRDLAQKAVLRHLAKAFPRYIPIGDSSTTTDWDRFRYDVMHDTQNNAPRNLNPNNLDPAAALVFWLGGLPFTDSSGDPPTDPSGKRYAALVGFSANPRNPFDGSGSKLPPLFEFQQTRLYAADQANGISWLRYRPETGSTGDTSPYVYFKSRSGTYYPAGLADQAAPQLWPTPNASSGLTFILEEGYNIHVRPYFDSKTNTYYNANSFQIISAGLDGLYGGILEDSGGTSAGSIAPHWPSAENVLGNGHYDNLTNFSKGTLEDMPK